MTTASSSGRCSDADDWSEGSEYGQGDADGRQTRPPDMTDAADYPQSHQENDGQPAERGLNAGQPAWIIVGDADGIVVPARRTLTIVD